jgi:MFS family permease
LINYLDRAALGVAAPLLSRDLRLSPAEMGVVFSAFFLGYTVFAFIGGHLADRVGPRRVYAWAASVWSATCALTAVVGGFSQLLVVRVVFGMAEGPMSATTNRMVANWFPRREVSRAVGFTFSGQPIGSALAAPIVGLTAVHYGWRPAFLFVGMVGLVWVCVWRVLATDQPEGNSRVAQEECALIRRGRVPSLNKGTPANTGTVLLEYLKKPSTWGLGAALFSANYTLYIFISWLPSYITNVHRLSMQQMSLVAAAPWVAGVLGYWAGGVSADFLYARLASGTRARQIAIVVPLVLAASTLAMLSMSGEGVGMSIALIAAAAALMTASVQACWAMLHEVVPDPHAGTVGGFVHFLSNISGIVGPSVTGVVIQYFGGYETVFLLAAGVALAGASAAAAIG